MKKHNIYFSLLLSLVFLWGCEKDSYPGAVVSPYIGIFDVRALYKGNDVALNTGNLGGSSKLAAMVVSDHSGGNLPTGLLVVQEARRLSKLRGISIALGNDATKYLPGDSVLIDINGGVLKRVNGILQITGLDTSRITRVSRGNDIPVVRVSTANIAANPDAYESTLAVILKGGFDPLPAKDATLSGEHILTDGFGNITLHTEAAANFSGTLLPVLANYAGIVFCAPSGDTLAPTVRMRTGDDTKLLSSTISVAPLVISGFASDVAGADGNYEYVQLLATRDIDFSVTPFSYVVLNNANASTPTGFPTKGWATGGMRSYKINITSGKVTKGNYCYVGGAYKLINGSGSTNMSTSNWVANWDYVNNDGNDFGTKTGGLMANSGNAFGMAIFTGTTVTVNSIPVDAVFVSGGGSLYSAGPPPVGYLIPNNDFYDIKDPYTLKDQPYYKAGSNTMCLAYNTADLGYFYKLGGQYSPDLGRWVKARAQNNFLMTKQTLPASLEDSVATKLK
ncbi:DUF5689 domain-containing protein [Chitinophaga sp. Cy-1792]|uniref:DUF5689 domain-containing protein n=1 Tax=Chitinophaga sp. Cy-1792 TaxID=2608339 RepID=UPI001963C264|nr:DUF5689 domain-containing protein [Chitinophaga sp. Cy-1792]